MAEVIQDEHDRDRLPCLADGMEAGRDGVTGIVEPVVNGSAENGGLIVGEEARSDRHAEYLGNQHGMSPHTVGRAGETPASG